MKELGDNISKLLCIQAKMLSQNKQLRRCVTYLLYKFVSVQDNLSSEQISKVTQAFTNAMIINYLQGVGVEFCRRL